MYTCDFCGMDAASDDVVVPSLREGMLERYVVICRKCIRIFCDELQIVVEEEY